MVEQIKNVLVHAGATWVLWLLFVVSVISLAIMVDRARVFLAQRDDVAELVRVLHLLLAEHDLEGARERLDRSRSAAAQVALAGLAQWTQGAAAAQEAMAAATGLQRKRMERRLLFLGTVGNNAPFVGLLGTVIGVIGAFEALGSTSLVAAASSSLAPQQVMTTIAEALVATALGLLVAIPAVAVFNYFHGLLTAALNDAEILSHVVLAHIGTAHHTEND